MATTAPATITARISESSQTALQALAKTQGKTVGALVRTAIEEFITRQDLDQLIHDLQVATEREQRERARQDALTAEALELLRRAKAEQSGQDDDEKVDVVETEPSEQDA